MEADRLTPSALHGAVVGVGIDLVDVARMAAALARTPTLAERIFTDDERAYCDAVSPSVASSASAARYAVRFAAKEAVMKALGVGLGAYPWHDVEVRRSSSGAPTLSVTGAAAALARHRGGSSWLVSLTHTDTLAQAIALLRA